MANCIYEGKEYSEGAEVCQGDVVKKCIAGVWQDTGRSCGAPADPDSLEVTSHSTRNLTSRAAGLCCQYFSIGQINRVGLRNTCTECKVAVINFVFGGGRSEIRKFKVAGKSNIEVDISGTQTTEIIDEEAC